MLGQCLRNVKNKIAVFHQSCYMLSSSEITASLRPFYFMVHPDLFAQNPRAQHINNVNLKLLNSYLDSLINNMKPQPLVLHFYLRSTRENGTLKTKVLTLNGKTAKMTLQAILKAFHLPTNYVDQLQDTPKKNITIDWNSSYPFESFNSSQTIYSTKKAEDLYSWLVQNMGKAEKRLAGSEPIRKDIKRLKYELLANLDIDGISWERGIGTTHLRGCLQGFKALSENYPVVKNILKGRHVHFGNETGISLQGSIILSTSEVRDQWLQLILRAEEVDSKIERIPNLQKAVSNCLRNIEIAQRKYQPYILAEAYSENLKRFVTSLGDFLGRSGFPDSWPVSLSHLQLVVDSAAGPLMLSPTGQIIAPSSCPPWLLVNFISENMVEAYNRIAEYESIKGKEKELYNQCMDELGLDFLDKDDSVSPQQMVDCLMRLIDHSYRLSPLLAGARVWITHYYSVMLDGEVCIPYDWD